MGIFYNPIDGGASSGKKLAIFVYILLCLVSIYATAESIISSFSGVSRPFGYLFTIGLFALVTFMLSIVKDGVNSRKIGKIIVGICIFSVGWLMILSTNTHKFFTMLKLSDIRTEEMGIAINALSNLQKSPANMANKVIIDYEKEVNNAISKFFDEMTNIERPCYAEEAAKLKNEVEKLLKVTIDEKRFLKRHPKTKAGCRSAATDMTKDMRATLENITSSMRLKIDLIRKCEDTTKHNEIKSELVECSSFSTDKPNVECKQTINDAHQYYAGLYDCTKDILINSLGIDPNTIPRKELALPVPSINLEKINALLPFIFEKNENGIRPNSRHISSFWMSFIFALIIDLGAFAILYNKILNNED